MKRILSAAAIAILLLALLAAPVTAAKVKASVWNVPGDFATIQEAIDSDTVAAGDTILLARGDHAGALVSKAVTIRGFRGAVISSGPAHSSGMVMGFRLLAGSDKTRISNLRFEVDLAIMNGGAVNKVVVEHCTFISSVQAVTNWRGNDWKITNNVIRDLKTRNGGGIGILVGDFNGGTVEGNVVSYNTISGTLNVGGGYADPSKEKGGYNGSGIVLYADFRNGSAGTAAIKNNRVIHNKVAMVSDNATFIDIAAFEMSDTRDDATQQVIFDNTVMFNDFCGTELQIDLTPDNLGDYNKIARNNGFVWKPGWHNKHYKYWGWGWH